MPKTKFTKEESNSAIYTLHYLQERLLLLLYPIIPQCTTLLANEKGINLLEEQWPKSNQIKSDLSLIEKLTDFNSKIWKAKKEKGISLRNPIEGIKTPKDLLEFQKDLNACHNI